MNRGGSGRRSLASRSHEGAARAFDVVLAIVLVVFIAPLMALVAFTVKLDSDGPVLYRCTRVGRDDRIFLMLKFRKMGVNAGGPPLTVEGDSRFTRLGRLLAASKLDELPQLWNVIKGDMSLVGPRPEDPSFVAVRRAEYAEVLQVRPGITGLSQLAFVKEGRILDPSAVQRDYLERLLPQKVLLDRLYARRWSLSLNVKILVWTFVAVGLRTDVAVDRESGRLGVRRRPSQDRLTAERADAAPFAAEVLGSER